MTPSFEEKSVWIQLVGMLIALGGYFAIAATMIARGVNELIAYVPLFIAATVLLVVFQILGHLLAAVLGRPEPRDERDRLIEWRAESKSGWILAVGILGGITAMIAKVEPVWVAHGLLLMLFLSHVACNVFQLCYYRRGMSGVGGA